MAALWIDAAGLEAGQDLELTAPSLREWLAGDWGLLFSHPDDFQDSGLENDRWLEVLRGEFRARGVRPLACKLSGPPRDRSWVSVLQCDDRVVTLEEHGAATAAAHLDVPADAPGMIDLTARALRRDILALHERFVIIVDGVLRRCGLVKYQPAHNRVSPLDLLSFVEVLRQRHGGRGLAA